VGSEPSGEFISAALQYKGLCPLVKRSTIKNHLESPQSIEELGEKLFDLRMADVSLCYAELLNTTEVRKMR